MSILRYLILLLIPFTVIGQSTYYVDDDGDNGGAGTIGDPWETLTYGENQLSGGDTLYVRAGTYNEYFLIFQSDGTYANNTVIKAYNEESVIVDGNGISIGAGGALINFYSTYTVLYGFEIKNANMTGVYAGGAGVHLVGDNTTISHCVIHDTWGGGIGLFADSCVAEYCTVYDACMQNEDGGHLSGWGVGISAKRYPNYAIIRNCTVHDIWGEGISTFEATNTTIEDNIIYDIFSVHLYVSDAEYCLVQRNLIYDTKVMTNGSQVGLGVWDEISNSQHNVIINNIVYGCRRNFYCGVQEYSLIYNNTFVNSVYLACVQITGAGSHIDSEFKNNIIVQDGALPVIYSYTADDDMDMDYNLWSKSPDADALGGNDVVGDPLLEKTGTYVDTAYYNPQSQSPAIGAGIARDSVPNDYLDSTRADPPTIGAVEYFADNPAVDPTVITTYKPYKTSPTTGIGGGNVTDDGGGTVSAKGVCWKTSSNPTTSDDHTDEGAGAGSFTSSITGINSTDTWHVRAYATNESGTSYGEDKTFRISYVTSGGKLIFDSNGKVVIYE